VAGPGCALLLRAVERRADEVQDGHLVDGARDEPEGEAGEQGER